MKFEREHQIGIKEIGVNNQMTNYGFLSVMEEVASLHSESVHMGITDTYITRKSWVILEWKLKIIKRPKYGEKIKVATWSRPIEKRYFYTYRDFEISLGDELVAIATSKWALVNIDTKKIAPMDNSIIEKYNGENTSVFNIQELPKLKEEVEKELKIEYTIRRADIDINKHVHNLNYLNMAYEVIPEKEYEKGEKNNVSIMYKRQILLGDTINCYYSKIGEKYAIIIKSKDDSVLHAIIELS